MAPPEDQPVPAIDNGSGETIGAPYGDSTLSEAPDATVVFPEAAPKEDALVIVILPSVTVVVPL